MRVPRPDLCEVLLMKLWVNPELSCCLPCCCGADYLSFAVVSHDG